MAKNPSIFVCQNCGAQSPKWSGQCFECGQWGTLTEELKIKNSKFKIGEGKKGNAELVRADKVKEEAVERIRTGIAEMDRVLGGGIVPGSVVLFAGEPGIGKSTLLTQIALNLANEKPQNKFQITNKKLETNNKTELSISKRKKLETLSSELSNFNSIIYVCGEESPNQVRMRIGRLAGASEVGKLDNIFLFPETDVDLIIQEIKNSKLKIKNCLVIVDSIQTLATEDLTGVAGSIGQVRESTHRLINFAKTTETPVFLVGHITKEGQLAGPKTIEHAVDTVLYFEGERSGNLRLLRSVKNRFGATDEVGVFEMTDKGLAEASDLFLATAGGRFWAKVGAAFSIVFEGTRPMAVEIQALLTKSFSPLPKRVINGLERSRSEMLLAVLQKYLRLPLWKYDVFLNVGGGLKITDPGSDLAVCAAVFSSFKNKPLPATACFVGEVSLLGEIKKVSRQENREKQARQLGFKISDCLTKIYDLKKIFE